MGILRRLWGCLHPWGSYGHYVEKPGDPSGFLVAMQRGFLELGNGSVRPEPERSGLTGPLTPTCSDGSLSKSSY